MSNRDAFQTITMINEHPQSVDYFPSLQIPDFDLIGFASSG